MDRFCNYFGLEKETFESWKNLRFQSRGGDSKSVPAENWKHGPTEPSPVDCASRGILPRKLQSHHLWRHGPEWLRMPASTWPQIDIALPEESLKEDKRMNNSVQLDQYNTHDDATHKNSSLVHLPARKRKQAIVNHSEEETAAVLQEDDREEEDEEEEEQGQEDYQEGEKEPQPHLKNSSLSHLSNWTPGDHIDPIYTDNVILVAANNFSSFIKLVKTFAVTLGLFRM